jgi:hypothetical protein
MQSVVQISLKFIDESFFRNLGELEKSVRYLNNRDSVHDNGRREEYSVDTLGKDGNYLSPRPCVCCWRMNVGAVC